MQVGTSASALATQDDPATTASTSSSSSSRRPSLSRLPSSFSAHLPSPMSIDPLARRTMPTALLSSDQARFPDLVRPRGIARGDQSPEHGKTYKTLVAYSPPREFGAAKASGGSRRSSFAQGNGEVEGLARPQPSRKRSLSVESLRRALGDSSFGAPQQPGQPGQQQRRTYSRSSSVSSIAAFARPGTQPLGTESVVEEPEEQEQEVAELSWGKWWPFAVTAPSSVAAGKRRASLASTAEEEPAATGSFLDYFAGKQATQRRLSVGKGLKEEEAEAELLNTDLSELGRAATVALPPSAVDTAGTASQAVPVPPPLVTRTSSFLPSNVFSAFSARPAGTSPSSSSTTAGASASPSTSGTLLDGPAAFFSSLLPSGVGAQTVQSNKKYMDSDDRKRAEMDEEQGDEMGEQGKEEEDYMDAFSFMKDKYTAPKLPMVFCHGLFGFDIIGPASIKPLQISYWIGVKEALEAIGAEVLITRVPASASIEERAKVLCESIEGKFAGREIILVGHSMGGLDGRYLISRLKPTTFKVRALATIASPHRGSTFADYIVEEVVGTGRMPALMGMCGALGIPGGGKAFEELTTGKMRRFNEETPDSPEVSYYSYGACFEPGWTNVFRVPWGVVKDREGDNDGLVSVTSSQWGKYQATLTNVNHLDLVGWIGPVRYGWAEWLGQPIKFKPVSFYLAVAEMMANEGF